MRACVKPKFLDGLITKKIGASVWCISLVHQCATNSLIFTYLILKSVFSSPKKLQSSIYLTILAVATGIMVRVFANVPGDLGSIPGQVMPKTQKMVLDATLLNTQHYKVRIKGKVDQSRERSSALPYTLV